MSPPAGSPAKICTRCGQDCSNKPRTKDAQGRYTCRACYDAMMAKAAARQPVAATATTEPDPLPFADDPLPADLLEEAAPAAGLQICPSCQSSMPHGAPICVQCGFDTRAGKQLGTALGVVQEETAVPPRGGKCGKCGYSLKGLKEKRCPECGTLIGRLTDRERRNRENAETVKWAYLKPVIQFGVGILGIMLYLTAMGEPDRILFHLVSYAIEVPIGVVVFLLCCAMWIGFDAPIHLIALRLAGVYALTNLTSVVVGLVPIWFVGRTIVLAVYIGMLAESLDLEIQDAVIVGLLTFLVKVLIVAAIVVAFMN